MNKFLVNVAIANAFFEEKRNYLETYFPFLLQSFHGHAQCDLNQISNNLKSIFGIELPLHTIKNILEGHPRIFQIKKLTRVVWTIALSQDGKKELNDIKASEERAENKLNIFYKTFLRYAVEKYEMVYEQSEVETKIKDFINKNLVGISIDKTKFVAEEADDFEKVFVRFLAFIKDSSLENVETFDDLWKGTIIWNELKKTNHGNTPLPFDKTLNVYIDTNFIFSLLELHNPVVNQAAKELYLLMKEVPNIQLWVMDSTIDEIHSLLGSYTSFSNDFFPDIEVDTVFYYLHKKGYTILTIERLKNDLIDKLKALSITYVETPALKSKKEEKWFGDIYEHLFNLRTKRNEKKDVLKQKNEYTLEKSATHDTSVISQVLSIKNRSANFLEASKAIFLTSSFLLYVDYKYISQSFESFPAVMLDTTFTNILYLKNPKKNVILSIDQVIKAHSKYLIIDRNIWAIYVNTINDLKDENDIKVEDYSRLFTKNQLIEDYLLNVKEDKLDKRQIMSILDQIKREEEERLLRLDKSEQDRQRISEEKTAIESDLAYIQEEKSKSERENRRIAQELELEKKRTERLEAIEAENQELKFKNYWKTRRWAYVIHFIGFLLFLTGAIWALLNKDVSGETDIKYPYLKPSLISLTGLISILFNLLFNNHPSFKDSWKLFFPKTRKKLIEKSREEYFKQLKK